MMVGLVDDGWSDGVSRSPVVPFASSGVDSFRFAVHRCSYSWDGRSCLRGSGSARTAHVDIQARQEWCYTCVLFKLKMNYTLSHAERSIN